ncbi:PIN domain-containing protein [Streptomyces pseudovenezuelae]|uniref:PIN-like domain-containing protein n=1 Tax=Streptomyces pseudovenezuelae TaxID=67350 RepID=UPI002E36C3AB|nr:PIN domain-containing protein [Streptomyces pseudovenezuelae]
MWRRPLSDYENGVKEYLVTLDTNVLLNLYRFTPQARNELLSVLESLQDRLWVSHQVVKEYYSRRMSAVNEHITLYTSVPKALSDSRNKAIQELNTFAKRRSMSIEDREKLIGPLNAAFDAVISRIKGYGEDFDLSLAKVATNDPILDALAAILDKKTGSPFEEEEAKSLQEEYARRASNEIPPGYRDANKAENSYGDFFLWEQVLREASNRKRPVLLVTNDAKDDWVQQEAGITIGPRPELMKEFKDRCGLDFLLTDLGTFLKVAKSKLGAAISESTVAQAENIEKAESRKEDGLVKVHSEEYDQLMDYLTEARNYLGRMISNPRTDSSRVTVAVALRRELEDVLVRVEVPAKRSLDGRFVYTDPSVWKELQRVRPRVRSSGVELRTGTRTDSHAMLIRRSRNIQDQIQQVLYERDLLKNELQDVEELLSIERNSEDQSILAELSGSQETLSRKIEELTSKESDLSQRLHDVQRSLRDPNA